MNASFFEGRAQIRSLSVFFGVLLSFLCAFTARAQLLYPPLAPLTSEQLRNKEMLEYSQKYKRSYLSYETSVNPYGNGAHSFFSSYIKNPIPMEQELTFEQLIETIQKKKLVTIEQVIKELPDYMKNENYVLMYRSRSLQEATPEAPRAIVYTPTSQLIVSFNGGNPKLRGSNTMEVIQFRQKDKKFEFRELEFDNKNAPRVSEANPSKCLNCHQGANRKNIDMRPNWEPYATWLGAYGSDDGDFSSLPLKKRLLSGIRVEDREALEQQAHEFELFKNYINNVAPLHSRYSLLGNFNLHGPVELTEHLSVWNFMRVNRLIAEEKEIYELYKELFAMGVKCSYHMDQVFEYPVLKWHLQFSFPQFAQNEYYERNGSQSPTARISSILTWLFEPLGIDTSDWSMDFQNGGRLAFIERFGSPSNPAATFYYAWYKIQADSAELDRLSCDELEIKAMSKLGKAFAEGQMQKIREQRKVPPPTAQSLISSCIQCHSGPVEKAGIPRIPFDRSEDLANLFSQSSASGNLLEKIIYRTSDMATQSEQMPPARRFGAEERQILIDYLKGFGR